MYIRGRAKIRYLTGETKEPAADDATYPTWDVENSMVMTSLVNSMEDDISSNYMCYHMAKELWELTKCVLAWEINLRYMS